MEEQNYLCVSCFQVITNPICPVCFLREVKIWLKEQSVSEKTKQKVTEELTNVLNNLAEKPADTNCILCGSRNVSLCMYCLIWKTNRIIKKYTSNKKAVENFEEIFNYNS